MTPSANVQSNADKAPTAPHRAILPLALVLALITGATVATTISLARAPISGTMSANSSENTVARFYAAANSVIRTGDATALDVVMSADAVVTPVEEEGESGRSGL